MMVVVVVLPLEDQFRNLSLVSGFGYFRLMRRFGQLVELRVIRRAAVPLRFSGVMIARSGLKSLARAGC
jgi:hypothetical protein